ncbi:MAG TPA: hypothetical protein VFO49_11390 [Nocardioides sp.]|nr:hypothetical protein [Nocardioides sp.]
MELHENLYALGLRLGREVFDDPDSFRGALDDFLDEDSATTGDINLLVDAVRLGAFASMTSMIGSGAQVTAAVEEAGSRLARDRGSADVAGAQWACAVLGFAIGKVSDAEVRRYRTQHATPQPPSQPLPPTQFPGQQPPQGVPPTQRPGAPVPGGQPTATGPLPTAQPLYGGQPGSGGVPSPPVNVPPPSSWPPAPAHQQPRKRKTWPILVAVVAVLAIVGGGAFAVIALQGDDDDNGGGGGGGGKQETEQAVDLESVTERYSDLAGNVGAGLDECEGVEASDGTSEELECGFANGTLALTTYESMEDLTASREANTGTDAGTRYSETDQGVIYGINNGSAVSEAEVASIYWDSNEGLQSGKFTASSDTVTIDQLVETLNGVEPVVAWPTEPEDEGMLELAAEFVNVEECDRIDTIQAGELEESICSAPDGITVFMGVFETMSDFKEYRRDALQQGSDQGNPLRNWNFDGNTREGAAAEYLNSSDDAVRYWDKPECRCYMEASLTGSSDLQKLEDWWVNA